MKKKGRIVIIIIVALFLVYNVAWGINFYRYIRYERALEYDSRYEMYLTRKDGYLYSVTKPSYLSFTGNLSISKIVEVTEEGAEPSTDIIIWPGIFGNSEVGIVMQSSEGTDELTITNIQLELDENLEPVSGDEGDKNLVDVNREKITELYEMADEMWDCFD